MQVAPRAWHLAAIPGLPGIVLLPFAPWVGLVLVAAALSVLAFFRDPDRRPPPTGFVAPADGRVSVIRTEDDRVRVGVYMNVLDVHVNRAPSGGTVTEIDHRPGAKRPAFTKDSDRNERVWIRFEEPEVADVALIAGTIARRIEPYVSVGDGVERGERIGHIAFGSRADVLLPPAVAIEDVLVEPGDRVRAGETVVALSAD